MRNILVTGANGFVGKNLVATLKQLNKYNIFTYDLNNTEEELKAFVEDSDFIFHLAGVNRPVEVKEFYEGNTGLTENIISMLKNKNTPILITSSIQAELDNDYGKSKRAAEEVIENYGKNNKAPVYIFRLPNVFGKWCRPNYNSAVATFCHNIANDIEVWISDETKELNLVYIDDVVKGFVDELENENRNLDSQYYHIKTTYIKALGEIVGLLNSFKKNRETLRIPDMKDEFAKKLYSTYLSYLPEDKFSYPLKMNVDNRGSFTEFIKSDDRGQVSINISKPGITKGNHWHHTKNEKFLVVSGEGVIKFRKFDSDKVIEYKVSGEKLEVIDIPVGYTHSITNMGDTDMVTVMWVNEIFDPEKPDTIYLEV
ncbi:NAD-dependent epimerase/dehydratase family protein [Clostridium sp. UBA4548]|uniref:polysaccharide biosynthesis C-terminal domain-containing protein n=1 Tax=Clostridium sp. UBA4548 TaxID=1946361 RepID=UPI0025B9526A|nr:NAD-dependent epimerase/dehydratase family protein [Clostridium sp. UBA4548]